MNELMLANLEQTDITNWNFEQLKEEIKEALSEYKTLVYTDDTIKMAKNDKALLAKAKKAIEDQRKNYKKRCLAPYDAVEPKVKEIVDMIENQRLAIDEVVKDYTDRQKAEKEKEVRSYYNKKSSVLGSLAGDLYEKLLNPKWLNASARKGNVEEEIQEAINNASNDISAIKVMESPFEKTLMETYISTVSMDEVRAKHTELMEAAAKAGLNQQADSILVREVPKAQVTANSEEGTILKVYASQSQLNQVLDFMKAIGVDYEIQ